MHPIKNLFAYYKKFPAPTDLVFAAQISSLSMTHLTSKCISFSISRYVLFAFASGLGSIFSGCADLAMVNYERALKNRQIDPLGYEKAKQDLETRKSEYDAAPAERK